MNKKMKEYLTEERHFTNGGLGNGFNSSRGNYYGTLGAVALVGLVIMIMALISL